MISDNNSAIPEPLSSMSMTGLREFLENVTSLSGRAERDSCKTSNKLRVSP